MEVLGLFALTIIQPRKPFAYQNQVRRNKRVRSKTEDTFVILEGMYELVAEAVEDLTCASVPSCSAVRQGCLRSPSVIKPASNSSRLYPGLSSARIPLSWGTNQSINTLAS